MARFENEEFVEITDKDLTKATNTTNTENTVGDEAPTEKVEAEVVEENITRPQNESTTYYRNASVNAPTDANEKKGMSIAGLVLGIVNVFGWLILIVGVVTGSLSTIASLKEIPKEIIPLIGVVTGTIGISLSAIAISKENKKGMSSTGLALSIVGVVISSFLLFLYSLFNALFK